MCTCAFDITQTADMTVKSKVTLCSSNHCCDKSHWLTEHLNCYLSGSILSQRNVKHFCIYACFSECLSAFALPPPPALVGCTIVSVEMKMQSVKNVGRINIITLKIVLEIFSMYV